MSESRSLRGLPIPGTFRRFLQVPDAGTDGVMRAVCDGEGDLTALSLSTAGAQVDGNFTVNGTATLPYLPAGPGAVARSIASKLDDFLSVRDFGAVPDGVTDATAAFIATMDAAVARGVKRVIVPPGEYVVSGQITIPHGVTSISGYGARIVQTAAALVFYREGTVGPSQDTVNSIAAGTRLISATTTVTDKYAALDWILVRDNNLIPTVTAGSRISCIRQLVSVSPGVMRLDAPVNRLMNNGTAVRKLLLAPEITLEGLTIEHISMDNKVSLVRFLLTMDPTFVDCHIGNNGGTALSLVYTVNGEWINSHTYNLRDDEDNGHFGYGVALAGACRGFRLTSGTATRVRHAITTVTAVAGSVPSALETLLSNRGEPESCVFGPAFHAFGTTNMAFDTHPEGFNILITPNATGCFGGVNIRATNVYVTGGMISSSRREGIRISGSPTDQPASVPIFARISGTVIDNISVETDRDGIRCVVPGAEVEIEGVRINGTQRGIVGIDETRITIRDVMIDCRNLGSSVGVELAGQNSDIDGLIVRNAVTGLREISTGSGNTVSRFLTSNVTNRFDRVPTYLLTPPSVLAVPGPFANDAAAATGGVAVGEVYRRTSDNAAVVRAA